MIARLHETYQNVKAARQVAAPTSTGQRREPMPGRPDGELDTVGQTEPAPDAREVVGDGALRDPKPVGDLIRSCHPARSAGRRAARRPP